MELFILAVIVKPISASAEAEVKACFPANTPTK